LASLADVSFSWQVEILKRMDEQKQATLDHRFQYNLGPAPNLAQDEQGLNRSLEKT
jgi:hypothetical protein